MSFTQPHGSSAPAGDDTKYKRNVGVFGGTLAASWLPRQLPPHAAIKTRSVSPSKKRSTRGMSVAGLLSFLPLTRSYKTVDFSLEISHG
jgi:hypothetical protein